jgi:hypothetical protein
LSRWGNDVQEFLLAREVKEIHIPLDGLIISVLVEVCVTLIAVAFPAREVSRISTVEALRIRGSSHEGWIMRSGWALGSVLVCASFLISSYSRFSSEAQILLSSPAVFGSFVGPAERVALTVAALSRT